MVMSDQTVVPRAYGADPDPVEPQYRERVLDADSIGFMNSSKDALPEMDGYEQLLTANVSSLISRRLFF